VVATEEHMKARKTRSDIGCLHFLPQQIEH
jgi:hypothetical protein